GRLHGLQTLERSVHHVYRVSGAVALGQNVLNPGDFEDGAHGTTSDDTSTFRCRLHVNLGGAVGGLRGVLQGSTVQIDLNHVAASRFHGRLHGGRHFAGLATTETYATLAITHHGQRGEGEDTTTFYSFRDAVNLNQLLNVAFVALLLVICHNLELQPAFTSSISQCLDTTVVLEARTVERHLGDTCGLSTLSDQLTNFLGSVDVAGGTAAQFFVECRGAGQDLVATGREDLGVDVLGRAIHTKAYDFQLAHLQTGLASATQTSNFL